MSIEEMFSKVKAIFPDLSRKRRRSSNYIEGPPPKFSKNVQEPRIFRNEPAGKHQVRKTLIGSMGSLFSTFKSKSNTCKPTEEEEYSDGEDVIFVQKFKKSDLTATRIQQNNIQSNKMDGANNRPSATRPPPGLIPKNKFSKIPDLQKFIKAPPSMNSIRTPRINGYQCENESNSSSRSCLVNGNHFSFKPPNSHQFDNTLLGRNFSNYSNIASTGGSRLTTANLLRAPNAAEEKLRYEKLLKSVLPDYGQNVIDHTPLPTSKRSIVQNHVISSRPPIRRSVIHILDDDDFHQKTEDTQRLFRESSISEQSRVTPVNTMRLKVDSTPVCQNSYPDVLKEKYLIMMRQRQEKITQQEEASNKLNSERLIHSNSYESLVPQWRPRDVVVFEEDIEEKVDDFPELSDRQRQKIREAMNGNTHSVLITKFNITITRDHILTLQWEPLAWLNDEVINFYMSLLTERGDLRSSDGYPKVYAMNTFFTQRLCTGGYAAVRRWTKKVDIFSCDIIPVPVHVGNVHWCMAIINMKEKTIKYYDSMGSPNNRVLSALEEYLREESKDKRKQEFDLSGWSKENVSDNPRQLNGSDCGVFSCMTAEFICRNRPIVFNQQHMNYFRQKMVLEICTGKLLL